MVKNKRKISSKADIAARNDISLDKSKENSKLARPVRRAVLTHKFLAANRSSSNSEKERNSMNVIDSSGIISQENNNATIRVVKNSDGITVSKPFSNKFSKMDSKNAKPKKSVAKQKKISQREKTMLELERENNDNDLNFFDRMAEQGFDDDIVDVSVGAEDQSFGMGIVDQDIAESQDEDCISQDGKLLPQKAKENSTRQDEQTKQSQEEFLKNPAFEKYINKLVNEKVEKRLELDRRNPENKLTLDVHSDQRRVIQESIPHRGQKRNAGGNAINLDNRLIKSPSDTTLYAPAVRRNRNTNTPQGNLLNSPFLGNANPPRDLVNISREREGEMDISLGERIPPPKKVARLHCNVENEQDLSNGNLIDKISNFVEGIRLDVDRRTDATAAQGGAQAEHQDMPSTSTGRRHGETISEEEKLSMARTRANRVILEAEQFKAQIETPKGRQASHNIILNRDFDLSNRNRDQDMNNRNEVMHSHKDLDEEFFHISCHIDQSLRDKIERGDFVELEKLLPRNNLDIDYDERMELVNKEGQMYFVPAQNRDNKIKNVRRWEQAFRVYAAIYSAANPHRSHEIWQYVYVINSAASCYVWEEVAQYDYMFRQLMARNPGRSWAVTYTQMWQMTLRHVINKGGQGGQNVQGQNLNGSYGYTSNNQGGHKKKRYCWKFNKGKCTDSFCKYPHKCFYCDGRHGIHTCFKKGRKSGDKINSPNKSK